MMSNTATLSQLDQLKAFTTVVADTGDFEAMKAFSPRDATTNPTLILKAIQKDEYKHLLDRAVADNRGSSLSGLALQRHIVDCLLVLFGVEILKIVPGRVSTEVDARLSFDVEGSIHKARELIEFYKSKGIERESILIKLASTWEGVQAAKVLQKEGINCNMTLLFSLPQAVACAEAGAKLVSPFVGRIYDWYKAKTGTEYHGADDPGVHSVQRIYNYYKNMGHPTEIMGASFRYKDQIVELAGCDLLTISPALMKELSETLEPIECRLSPDGAQQQDIERLDLDEKAFRFKLNENAMATEKLAEGIRLFTGDVIKLEGLIEGKL